MVIVLEIMATPSVAEKNSLIFFPISTGTTVNIKFLDLSLVLFGFWKAIVEAVGPYGINCKNTVSLSFSSSSRAW